MFVKAQSESFLSPGEAFLSVVTSEDDFPSARTEINLLCQFESKKHRRLH